MAIVRAPGALGPSGARFYVTGTAPPGSPPPGGDGNTGPLLDWELRNWPALYHAEVAAGRCLEMPWRHDTALLPQVLLVDGGRRWRGLSQVRLGARSTDFVLPSWLRSATEHAFQSRLHALGRQRYRNERLLRLSGAEILQDGIYLDVQGVHYEDCLRTNLSLDAPLGSGQESLRSRLHGGGALEPLASSPLANPLGANLLLFTREGALVMPRRSAEVLVRPGELGPSSSGDFSREDVPGEGMAWLKGGRVLRETREELNLDAADLDGEVSLLGLCRELVRGGKPEMYLRAVSTLTAEEINKRWAASADRFETERLEFFEFGEAATGRIEGDGQRSACLSRLAELIDLHAGSISLPLWAALALWCRERLGGA